MKLSEYRLISKAINDDVVAAFKKHGFDARKIAARVDETLGVVKFSLEAVDLNHKGKDGNATTPEAELFKSQGYVFGFRPEQFGATFRFGGNEYEIAGLRARGKKCVIGKRKSNGTNYVFAPEDVKRMLVEAPR